MPPCEPLGICYPVSARGHERAEGFNAIEEFGRFRRETLKEGFRLPNGIPSRDKINRVFQSIDFW